MNTTELIAFSHDVCFDFKPNRRNYLLNKLLFIYILYYFTFCSQLYKNFLQIKRMIIVK